MPGGAKVGETNYDVPLGDEGTDRSRLECTTVKGIVTIFSVQYEAFIAGKWVAIVRYDTAPDTSRR